MPSMVKDCTISLESRNPTSPKPLEQLSTRFIWDQGSFSMFKLALDSPDTRDLVNDFLKHDFEETQFVVDIAVQKF